MASERDIADTSNMASEKDTADISNKASEKDIADITKILKDNNMSIETLKELVSVISVKQNDANFRSTTISDLQLESNNHQQYLRNWSIRLHGVSVPADLLHEAGEDFACMFTAYNKVIYHVLATLVVHPDSWKPGLLTKVPKCSSLLSNGHFVGKQVEGKPRTIIIRFTSRYLRNLFLKHKFENMPKPSASEITKVIRFYAAYPDLTHRNHAYVMGLKEDQRVKAAWAFDGHIKFTLKADKAFTGAAANPVKPEVYRVKDIRVPPYICVDQAAANKTEFSPRRSRKDYDRRYTRSYVAEKHNGEPTKKVDENHGGGRGGQPGGPSGQSAGRGRHSGGRGGQSGGRGRQSGGRGGQSVGHSRAPNGRGGASGVRADTRARSPAPSRSPHERWQAAPINSNSKSSQDKFKGESNFGKLPTDQDILINKFNAANLNEQC